MKFKLGSSVVKDFIWRVIYTVFKQGLIFFIFLLSARSLEPHLFGVYNYVLSAVFFLILLSDFGISTATSKYVAQYNSTEKEKLQDVVFNVLTIIAVFTALISLFMILFGKMFFKENYVYFLLFLPLIFLVPATSVYDGIYRGLKKFKIGAMITLCVCAVFAALVPFLIFKYKMIGAIISQDLFYLVLFLTFVIIYKNFYLKLNKQVIVEIGRYSIIYGLAVISYQIFARIDVLFLGYYGYLDQVATYELLNKIFAVLVIPFTLLGQVIAPRFTELFYSNKNYKIIYQRLKVFTVIFLGSSIFFGLLGYILMPLIIGKFFPGYINGYFSQIFVISLIIFTLNIATATIDHGIIVATGHAKLMTLIYSFLAVINIILNVVLIKYFGYMGVLFATLFCVFIMVVALRILFFKEIQKQL